MPKFKGIVFTDKKGIKNDMNDPETDFIGHKNTYNTHTHTHTHTHTNKLINY